MDVQNFITAMIPGLGKIHVTKFSKHIESYECQGAQYSGPLLGGDPKVQDQKSSNQ